MSTPQMSVVPIMGPGRFRALGSGEVFQGGFEGHPLVSVHEPSSSRGAAAKLNRLHLDVDFQRLMEGIKREFGSASIASLQIKFIVAHKDEVAVKELCRKHGINPAAVAGVEENATLDVFFFAVSGRLRIAPSAASFRESPKTLPDSQTGRKAKVLIVDDSKTMRALLRRIIEGSKDLEVIAEAELPSHVEELIAKHNPDVMTLDINMPEMSGVQLLKKILAYRFIPTVMISAVTINDGEEVLKALELGAVDYIHKPEASELKQMTPFIQEKVLNAARVRRAQFGEKLGRTQKVAGDAPTINRQSFNSSGLIAIGASTGGTEAIKQIFLNFPKEIPPIVVVQHIPPYFSTAFANRLNELCKFEVREAVDGDEVRPGRALIAPGGMHLEVKSERGRLIARLSDGEPVNRFKPSVDVLFNSVSKAAGKTATGVLLTGMGSDGAKGLLAMKNAGSFTIAQNEESCVVYGMPRAAFELGAASIVESLDDIPFSLMSQKAA